jgi:hypothetical protein
MAPKKDASCTAWKSIAPTAVITEEDNGDILQPLKRVCAKYLAKAAELTEKAPGSGASDEHDKLKRRVMLSAAASYTRMAACVERLTGLLDVNESAAVDQTEVILSDRPDAVTRAAAYDNMEASVIRQLEDIPSAGAVSATA